MSLLVAYNVLPVELLGGKMDANGLIIPVTVSLTAIIISWWIGYLVIYKYRKQINGRIYQIQDFVYNENSLGLIEEWYHEYFRDSTCVNYTQQFNQHLIEIKHLHTEVKDYLNQLKADLELCKTYKLFSKFLKVYWVEPHRLIKLDREAEPNCDHYLNKLRESIESAFSVLKGIVFETRQRIENSKKISEEIEQIISSLEQAKVITKDSEERRKARYYFSIFKSLLTDLIGLDSASIEERIWEDRYLMIRIHTAQRTLNKHEDELIGFFHYCKVVDSQLSYTEKILSDVSNSVRPERLSYITDSNSWPASLAEPFKNNLKALSQEAKQVVQRYLPLTISILNQASLEEHKAAYQVIQKANKLIDDAGILNQRYYQLKTDLSKMWNAVVEAEKRVSKVEEQIIFLTDINDYRTSLELLRKDARTLLEQYRSPNHLQVFSPSDAIFGVTQEARQIQAKLSPVIQHGLESQKLLQHLFESVDPTKLVTESKGLPERLIGSLSGELELLRFKALDLYNEIFQLSSETLVLKHLEFNQKISNLNRQINNGFWDRVTQVKNDYEEVQHHFEKAQQEIDKVKVSLDKIKPQIDLTSLKERLQRIQEEINGLRQEETPISSAKNFVTKAQDLKPRLINISKETGGLAENGRLVEQNYITLINLIEKVDNMLNSVISRMKPQPRLIQLDWKPLETKLEKLEKSRTSLGEASTVRTPELIEIQKNVAQQLEQNLLSLSKKVETALEEQNELTHLLQKLHNLDSKKLERTVASLQTEADKYAPENWSEYNLDPACLNKAGELLQSREKLLIWLQPMQFVLPEIFGELLISTNVLLKEFQTFKEAQSEIESAIKTMGEAENTALIKLGTVSNDLDELSNISAGLNELLGFDLWKNLGGKLDALVAAKKEIQSLLDEHYRNLLTVTEKVQRINELASERQKLLEDIQNGLQAVEKEFHSELENKVSKIKVLSTFSVVERWLERVKKLRTELEHAKKLLAEKEMINNNSRLKLIILLFNYLKQAKSLYNETDIDIIENLINCRMEFENAGNELNNLRSTIQNAQTQIEPFPIDFSSEVKFGRCEEDFQPFMVEFNRIQSKITFDEVLDITNKFILKLKGFRHDLEDKVGTINNNYRQLDRLWKYINQEISQEISNLDSSNETKWSNKFLRELNELKNELVEKQRTFQSKLVTYQDVSVFLRRKDRNLSEIKNKSLQVIPPSNTIYNGPISNNGIGLFGPGQIEKADYNVDQDNPDQSAVG